MDLEVCCQDRVRVLNPKPQYGTALQAGVDNRGDRPLTLFQHERPGGASKVHLQEGIILPLGYTSGLVFFFGSSAPRKVSKVRGIISQCPFAYIVWWRCRYCG